MDLSARVPERRLFERERVRNRLLTALELNLPTLMKDVAQPVTHQHRHEARNPVQTYSTKSRRLMVGLSSPSVFSSGDVERRSTGLLGSCTLRLASWVISRSRIAA